MHNILQPLDQNIFYAAELLRQGKVVSFPTETVYGLGGNAYDNAAIARIFKYKDRPAFNPISVCYSNIEHASADVEFTDLAKNIAEQFLPGPITIVLKRKSDSKLSWLCSAGQETIGIRIPDSSVALSLLSKISFPLAAPSANRSSDFSPTTAQAVSESLSANDDLLILDGGKCKLGIESTIIDISTNVPKILRIGAVSVEEIESKCKIHLEHAKSPSHSLRHYRPSKEIIINAMSANLDDAILAFGVPFYNNCKYVLNLSKTGDLNEAASNFFFMLRELDKTDAARICVMPIPQRGMGAAINDKLRQACQ